MVIREVTHESWAGRLGRSIKGVVFGLLLVAVAAVALFWGEGRAVREAKTIEEGRRTAVSMDAARVEPANEGKLVHLTGQASTEETLADATFGMSAAAVRLRRIVEMYQWEEHKKTRTERRTGGGTRTETTYEYERTWSQRPIDSGGFKDSTKVNPPDMPYRSETWTAREVRVGAFRLSATLVGQFSAYEPLAVAAGPEAVAPAGGARGLEVREGGYYLPRGGSSSGGPRIGDCRIHFEVIRPGPVSIISRQAGQTFEPYRSQAGNTIDMLVAGRKTAEEMWQSRGADNRLLTWAIRGGGFLAIFIGFLLILQPIAVLGDAVPLVGSLLGAGTFVVSLVLAWILSLVVIAAGWIVYRPVWGAALLAAAAVVLIGSRVLFTRRGHPG